MLAFITSLRHPQNSADYAKVEALLEDTISSLRRQLSSSFSIWVVGNQQPRGLPSEVNWIEVDYPPPTQISGPRTGVPAVLLDKGTKLVAGFAAAREIGPTHIMFVDADDLVSRRLASLSASDPDSPGWRITKGWRWASSRHALRSQRDFHNHCGTAFIVRPDLLEVPSTLTSRSSQEEIASALQGRLERSFGSHMHLAADLEAAGTPLRPVPFRGALYRVSTGENHSGISLGGLGRPVGPFSEREFGIPQTPPTPSSLLRAIFPSRRGFLERLPLRRFD